MGEAGMKRLFYFSLAVLFSIILVWFGSKFLFFTNDHISSAGYFWSGLALMLGGILYLASPDFRKYWWVGAILVLIGIYLFARASGVIEFPWLARILGAASWLAAVILLYITWPGKKKEKNAVPEA